MVACIYSVVPALFKFVGIPLLWKYPLTEEKVRAVQAEIERKNQGVAAEST
jgi:Na+/melibiose symporter-like transporter